MRVPTEQSSPDLSARRKHIFPVLFLCLPSGNTIPREAVPRDMKSCHDYIATSVLGLRSHPKMPARVSAGCSSCFAEHGPH